MTTGVACPPIILQFTYNSGQLAAGGSVLTQVGGTNAATYQDVGLTTPLPNPIPLNSRGEISNASGASCQLFLTPNTVYTFTISDANGNQVWVATYVNGVQVPGVNQASIGALLYPQTATELAAGVTPINFWYPPENVFRYYSTAQIAQTVAFSSSPTIDCSAAINAAVKSTTGDVFFPTGIHYINLPIYIPSTATQNVRFVGESRTNTKIEPMSNSIADPLGINAMVINQATNEKFSLSRIRLTTGDDSTVNAWAGFSLHAVQPQAWNSAINYVAGAIVTSGGSTYVCTAANINELPPNASFWTLSGTNSAGYTAGACNYIFSGSIEDCWFDAGGVQPMFVGGLNNYHVVNNTFEFQKGCFSITGGTADAHFVSNSLSNCFDYFLACTMSPNANIISVRGIHAYTHNRGLLFLFINAWSILIDDVTLQASTGGSNLGSVGIGSFVTTTDLELSNLNVLTSATLGTGATATQLTFQGCSGTISDSILDGCDTGIFITGSAANRLTFDHVDIQNVLTAAFRNNTGTPTGVIRTQFCDWSNAQTNILISTNVAGYDFYADHCTFLNAGLGGATSARNVTLATTGTVRMSDCIIGQNNAGAAASYYIDNAGSGQAILVDPAFIGTPPVAVQNPSATQNTSIGRLAVPYSASMTFSAALSDWFEISATNATAFTINAPIGLMDGKEINVTIRNTSGGALGAVTWNSIFKLSTWTSPATGNSRTIRFRYDGSNLIQLYQATVDVPN